ncbi:hypothetical protein [Actinophytocola sp.]|uniref:hypothetical protein n=1 Tax=Actinophytocola sp. TaxID=1872138 RepID=UPI002ED01F8C
MANDHHQSAFDEDQFDRYDTVDSPITDTVDPNRTGLVGDIGRLIDEIRINLAASKLDDNVAVGEDRALNGTGNWAAVPHEQLYSSVHTNNNPSEAYSLAKEWTDLGNMMAENSRVMDATIRSTESGWQGPAAEVARQATLKLATWGGDAAQTSQYMGTRIADQGLAAERAKATMPEPKNFDYEKMLRDGFASGGLAGFAQAVVDVQAASAASRSAHQQAVQVMSDMEAQSRDVDETTPRFVRPPEVTDGGTEGTSMSALQRPSAPLAAQIPGTPTLPNAPSLPNAAGVDPGGAVAAAPGGVGAAGLPGGTGGAGGTGAAFAGGTVLPGGSMPGGPVVPGGAGVPGGVGMPGGFSIPDGSVPGAGDVGSSFSTGGVPGGTSSQQRGGGSYTPPNMTVPDIDFGTGTAGYTPPNLGGHTGGTNFGGTGFKPDTPDFSNFLPPGVTTGRGGSTGRDTGSPGYVPPRLPTGINPATGLPYTPDEIRRGVPSFGGGNTGGNIPSGRVPGVAGLPGGGFPGGGGGGFSGGGAGGFGGGGAGAAGAGGGFGRGGGLAGPGSYAGAYAAEQAATARGAAGFGPGGQTGANGAPGAGAPGAGGRGSGGGEDKEHRNKYATNEKIIDEPGRMVPTVIGEKSAKQLKEEQPG